MLIKHNEQSTTTIRHVRQKTNAQFNRYRLGHWSSGPPSSKSEQIWIKTSTFYCRHIVSDLHIPVTRHFSKQPVLGVIRFLHIIITESSFICVADFASNWRHRPNLFSNIFPLRVIALQRAPITDIQNITRHPEILLQVRAYFNGH